MLYYWVCCRVDLHQAVIGEDVGFSMFKFHSSVVLLLLQILPMLLTFNSCTQLLAVMLSMVLMFALFDMRLVGVVNGASCPVSGGA